MSEVTSRSGASRGRGSSRGGRGGFSNRGGRSAGKSNGDTLDSTDTPSPSAFEEDADIAALRKLYGSKIDPIKDMFQGWSDVDILYALQETDGDENLAVERIAHGAVSQWGEVSKPKKSSRSKPKDVTSNATDSYSGHKPARGGRIASESGRGRGRGADRGGRPPRGRSVQPATNGARKETNLSVPTEESSAWDTQKNNEVAEVETQTATAPAESPASVPEPTKTAPAPAKTWASMLRQATAPKQPPKPKEAPVQKPAETLEPLPPAEPESKEAATVPEAGSDPAEAPISSETSAPATEQAEDSAELASTPDQLTESNLDRIDDSRAVAPPTDTAASTAADSWVPTQTEAVNATPTPATQTATQPPPAVPTPAGFGASSMKPGAGRPQHYQRRILDQEEAVRMPGNREVDRAAVQFGAFSLNGAEEDVDGEREEAETRAQPPVDSPVAHPRASLPPVGQPHAAEIPTQQQKAPIPAVPTTAPTAPASQTQPQQAAPQSQPAVQSTQPFGRFGQAGAQEGAPGFSLGQQGTAAASSQQQFDNFPSQQQPSQLPQSAAGFSSAPGDFSSYYTADQHNRGPYNYYGQQYGQQQQHTQAQQEATSATQQPQAQRSFSGYNNPSQADNLSQYPQSGVGSLHNQSRFGGVTTDPQSSGHTTPNPPAQAQGQQQQGAQGSQPQSHGQQNYPYNNHPYFNNPYYHSYYAQAYNQGGYGAAPYGKAGVYGGPAYSMPPQAPYDHSSSPAAGFQSSLHRENNGIGSGLGDYGRVGSSQSGHQSGLGGSSFGGMHDTFGRGPSSFQSQAGQGFNAQSQAGASATANDDLKPYVDSKSASGPSPSLAGARPGSAANNPPAGQSGLPPQSNAQMGGYGGGYPSHLQQGLHGSSGYNVGAGNSGSQHGNTPYGSYGQGGGFGGYYGAGNQQQGQQQRGGWGGNYNH